MISHLRAGEVEVEVEGEDIDIEKMVMLFDHACKRYVELSIALREGGGEGDSAPGERPESKEQIIPRPAVREVEQGISLLYG